MRVLFLTHAFNALAQRLFVALRDDGHEVSIELDVNDEVTREAVALAKPDVVVAPFLKRAIPEDVWSRVPCLVVHPGPPGDGGPSSLDRAIQEGVATWGVTVLQAVRAFDAGPVWAHASFPMRLASKGSLYRLEVTEAAVACVREALARMARGESPTPVAQLSASRFRPAVTQAERAIDWARDDTLTVLRKVHAADGSPGVRDVIAGRDVFLHGAHAEAVLRGGEPGAVIATRDGAILRATRDGAVWITHLRAATAAEEPALKLAAVQVLGADALAGIPESIVALDAVAAGATWRETRYEQHGDVGVLHFAFHNGAMSTAQCHRLLEALRFARTRCAKVLVLAGGSDFWSNGIHLHAIEATGRAADASWENINAIDDVAREIVTMDDRLTVAAVQANAGAGGVFLALAADHVWMRDGVVLNPHYRGMGNLYGSEYWTYLLPRRVGGERARDITERRLPMGSREALALGLADACFGRAPEAFLREAIERAQAVAANPAYGATLAAKQRSRAADEAARPLASYRDAELARMKLNFYGFDSSYHVARYHFVHRLPKARTPGYLASHRGRAG